MARPRYSTSGPWFRGNTHIHTTKSDGGLDYDEVTELYAGLGYDFLFVTDHGYVGDIERRKSPLLALNGTEIDGNDRTGAYYHVVGLGTGPGVEPGTAYTRKDFMKMLRRLKRCGAVTILAHPHWTGNSVADALRHRFDGVEVYNHVCHWLNGKSSGAYHWDCMLESQGDVLGFAADDAHIKPAHPGYNGGWIMVQAPKLTKANVLRAIRAGRFYSTTGPVIRSIKATTRRVEVKCSPAREVLLAGRRSFGQRLGMKTGARRGLTKAVFEVKTASPYLRLEVEGMDGARAWTNCLFHRGR